MFWMVLVACGGKPTEACQQMLDCDAAWAAIDELREPEWEGEDDAVYGKKGTCWKNSDNEAACDAACTTQLIAYGDELELLAEEGEIDAIPAVCPQ